MLLVRDDSTNLQPPFYGPGLPVYPTLPQFVRIPTSFSSSSSAVPLTSAVVGGNTVCGAYTQQFTPPLGMRDREPCYVFDPSGGTLTAGFYYCRLVASYSGLPLYATVPHSGELDMTGIDLRDCSTVSQLGPLTGPSVWPGVTQIQVDADSQLHLGNGCDEKRYTKFPNTFGPILYTCASCCILGFSRNRQFLTNVGGSLRAVSWDTILVDTDGYTLNATSDPLYDGTVTRIQLPRDGFYVIGAQVRWDPENWTQSVYHLEILPSPSGGPGEETYASDIILPVGFGLQHPPLSGLIFFEQRGVGPGNDEYEVRISRNPPGGDLHFGSIQEGDETTYCLFWVARISPYVFCTPPSSIVPSSRSSSATSSGVSSVTSSGASSTTSSGTSSAASSVSSSSSSVVPPGIVQTILGSGTGNPSVTFTSITVQAGALLVVDVAITGTVMAPTATYNGVSMSGTQVNLPFGTFIGAVWTFNLVVSSLTTANLVVTGLTTLAASVVEVTGLANNSQDQSASQNGTSSPSTGATGTTTFANEYVHAAFVLARAGIPPVIGSWINGFSSIGQDVSFSDAGAGKWALVTGYQIVAATGTFTAALSGSTEDQWAGLCETFD